jgi:hypothetical protein
VYLGYWTSRVSSDGLVQFRPDVYGVEGRLGAKLAERLERMKTSAVAAVAATAPDGAEANGRGVPPIKSR